MGSEASPSPPKWVWKPCIMGIDEASCGPVLGPMVYGCLYCSLSHQKILSTLNFAGKSSKDHLQKIMKYQKNCGVDIAHPEKFRFSHPTSGRGGGHGSHPNDGGSQSSNMQGGSATLPLYTAGSAAGAANSHHSHHRNHCGATHNYNCMDVVTLSCSMLACLLLREAI